MVGPIKETPPNPKTKDSPGLSKKETEIRNDATKSGMDHTRKLRSFLTNGKTKMKAPIGITKNCIPPQEANPKLRIIPEETILIS